MLQSSKIRCRKGPSKNLDLAKVDVANPKHYDLAKIDVIYLKHLISAKLELNITI